MAAVTFLYSTAPDPETARRIADTLVAEKLAACVNMLAPMQSVYVWEGAIERSEEIALIVKTTETMAATARDRIVSLHPYDCPCVTALKIDEARSFPPFLEWVKTAVSAKK